MNTEILHDTLIATHAACGRSVRLKRRMASYFNGPMRLLEPLLGGPFKARFRSGGPLIKQALETEKAESGGFPVALQKLGLA